MRKILSRIGVVGVVAALGVTILPQMAMAAGSSTSCSLRVCHLTARNFPGGTISVDADSANYDGSDTAHWAVGDADSPIQCQKDFPIAGGVRSWTCSGVHSGTVTMVLTGPAPLKMGLRW